MDVGDACRGEGIGVAVLLGHELGRRRQMAGGVADAPDRVGRRLLGFPVCAHEVHQLDEGVSRIGHLGEHVVGDVRQVRCVVALHLGTELVGEFAHLADVRLDAAVAAQPGRWSILLRDHRPSQPVTTPFP
ncbi:hypothetical protein KIF24_26135 [Micromonospora sp. Llam7]|nr:hypothetical protein [Micromonospora tarapacensis]MBX7269157.1 hypothetical protein [Micromonospora tarapacensis]